MTTGREANVNSLRPSVCNFSEFPCPSNRGRFNLRLPLATVNQQLHCLALELLVVSFLNLLFLHGFSLFTLSFRVRKIRGGSVDLLHCHARALALYQEMVGEHHRVFQLHACLPIRSYICTSGSISSVR